MAIYLSIFVNATGDKKLWMIKYETYLEYNRRYPDGSGDELMKNQYIGYVKEDFDEDDIEYYMLEHKAILLGN